MGKNVRSALNSLTELLYKVLKFQQHFLMVHPVQKKVTGNLIKQRFYGYGPDVLFYLLIQEKRYLP